MLLSSHKEQLNFSQFSTIFCDSLEALQWARDHGLPRDAIVKTSAPALLLSNEIGVVDVEDRWTAEELARFQESIQDHTQEVFDAALSVEGVGREKALSVASLALGFQRFLYKAACLDEGDFSEPRLIVRVEGEGGPAGNNMNAPWCKLLNRNPQLSTANFFLSENSWGRLAVHGVGAWKRFRLAGLETLFFRLALHLGKFLPDRVFNREVLIPNEHELLIESAAHLVLRGAKLSTLLPDCSVKVPVEHEKNSEILEKVLPIIHRRSRDWLVPFACDSVLDSFEEKLLSELTKFDELAGQWVAALVASNIPKKMVLMNHPGGLKGYALFSACKRCGVKLVAVQHAVTIELSNMHGEASCNFDGVASNVVLTFNPRFVEREQDSPFSIADHIVVGMSRRHLRMASLNIRKLWEQPLVYVSTNLYKGNMGLFISSETDHIRARAEIDLVSKVFRRLPHKLRYKTYPMENRRYADEDPVLEVVESAENIELYKRKLDMRYLFGGHRVVITSSATSTLSWAVMTGKPVVFINWERHSPLRSDAYFSLSNGLFLFDGNAPNFHDDLFEFLSRPIVDIERLWEEKAPFRKKMISDFFSAYASGAGYRAANWIVKHCL